MTGTTQQDGVRFLRNQHDEIRSLLREAAKAEGEGRRAPFERLVRLLAVHETAEEIVVYPMIRNVGADGDSIADRRLAEEESAKDELSELERLDVTSGEFERRFRELRKAVEGHAKSEEREVFPLIEQVSDDKQLEGMARALEAAESMAPTHPHKAAPTSATGNLLVGPMVAVVDRVRDALRSATRTMSGRR
jgi:hemerythrin superfamily protein